MKEIFLKCKPLLQVLVVTVLGVLQASDFLASIFPHPATPQEAEQTKNQARCLPTHSIDLLQLNS